MYVYVSPEMAASNNYLAHKPLALAQPLSTWLGGLWIDIPYAHSTSYISTAGMFQA